MSKTTKARALDRLQNILRQIRDLKGLSTSSLDFKEWRENAEVAIRLAFEENSARLTKFRQIRFYPLAIVNDDISPSYESYQRGLQSAEAMLKSMVQELEWSEEDKSMAACRSLDGIKVNNRKVFVVHGHDEAAKHEAARFIEQLELDPVILAEQPSKGRTIIEKFDEHADVGYAIALLTADDIGSRQGEDRVRPRARQNVIFELGYFIGRLGRERVCALTKGEPEIPSDYSGVVYISMDASDWKMELIRELKAAGFDIDANRAYT